MTKEKIEHNSQYGIHRNMSTKELALRTIQELPETASWEEIEERIHFLAAIERGREEIRSGKIIPHEKIKENLKAWVTR